jgi:hypothetical protein
MALFVKGIDETRKQLDARSPAEDTLLVKLAEYSVLQSRVHDLILPSEKLTIVHPCGVA